MKYHEDNGMNKFELEEEVIDIEGKKCKIIYVSLEPRGAWYRVQYTDGSQKSWTARCLNKAEAKGNEQVS